MAKRRPTADATAPVVLDDGRITLYRGDTVAVMRSLADCSIDLVFTDPPYGHNNNDGDLIANREKALGRKPKNKPAEERPILNDGAEANQLVRTAMTEWARLLRRGCCCCCCCCGGGGPDPQFARWSLWIDQTLQFKQMIVWDKGPMGMGWHYRRSYETVLVAEKPGAACRWYDESDRVENIIRPGAYGIGKIIPAADQHPTEKPPQLAAHFIRLHSEPGHTVLDSFMGRGSTGVAAAMLGRRFIGIELDPEHFAPAEKAIRAAVRRRNLAAKRGEPTPLETDLAIGADSEHEQVFAVIRKYRGATERLIARHTRLSAGKVRRICDELVAASVVEQQGSGGRDDPFGYDVAESSSASSVSSVVK